MSRKVVPKTKALRHFLFQWSTFAFSRNRRLSAFVHQSAPGSVAICGMRRCPAPLSGRVRSVRCLRAERRRWSKDSWREHR